MSTESYADNERWWDERAAFHLDTPMYREFVERLRDGHDALLPFDNRVLGDVDGLDVLHLQCHVGTDTLSLARRGARVTGVDFSEASLQQARGLAADLGIEASFVHGNAIDLPVSLQGPFDLVYTSYGVLCWLDDLMPWAAGIASRLRPGGRLVVIDCHPLWRSRADKPLVDGGVLLRYPYLPQRAAMRFDDAGSYASPTQKTEHDTNHDWSHGIGAMFGAVRRAGLSIDRFEEHPEGYYQATPTMTRGSDRLWRLPEPLHGQFPLTFTLVAKAPTA